MRFRYYVSLLILFLLSLSAVLVSAAPAEASAKIIGVRWGRTTDAVTGAIKVRVVLETSGPVEVDQFITAKPNWRLVVTLRGANADQLTIPPSPDQTVVKGMSLVKSTKDTVHAILELPGSLPEDQYKVFTVKADPKAKRPFRVVIDVEKSVPMSDVKFSAGLKGKLIVLDPGHGGSDPGAIGPRRTYEKNLNLSLGMQVKAILERSGAQVVMTRQTDIDCSTPDASDRDELRARTMVANDRKADLFISIHHNASANTDLSGTTTYYYRKTMFDVVLAQCLQDAMIRGGGLDNIGVRTANFFVVKNTWMPAALLEIGFISNPQEEQILNSSAFQQKMALAIVAGIDQFFGQAAKMRGEQ
ncbi:MAG TPA: N-acetylmuramoyl-L-alanine amidase [Negativicutes bacterium]|nr:N-acetylmuramoyl-L-alanine amidase [Negativicutes bacterium]